MRNPLTAIKLYADIAHNQTKQVGNKALIGTVGQLGTQIDKLITLMDYLLDVSKIQSDTLELEKTSFDLGKLVHVIGKSINLSLPQRIFAYRNTLYTLLLADKERLSQVISNLILNAVKYSPDGGKIIIVTRQEKKQAIFSVQDFGVGISRTDQHKLFTRFFRADVLRQKKISGVGLGLYIAQKIIKAHGGKIGLTSKKGVGSTFRFNIPLPTA